MTLRKITPDPKHFPELARRGLCYYEDESGATGMLVGWMGTAVRDGKMTKEEYDYLCANPIQDTMSGFGQYPHDAERDLRRARTRIMGAEEWD